MRTFIKIIFLPISFPIRLIFFFTGCIAYPVAWVWEEDRDLWKYLKSTWWDFFNPFKL